MKKNRSRWLAALGALAFAVAGTAWLALSGDRAVADAERSATLTRSLTRTNDTSTTVTFGEAPDLVQRVAVHLRLRASTDDARRVRIHLTAPSGIRVLVQDGPTSGVVSAEGLDAFAGEQVAGDWKLSVEPAAVKVISWSLTADMGPAAYAGAMETYGEYDGPGPDCDCEVGAKAPTAVGSDAPLLLLGLALLLAWRSRSTPR